MQQTTVEREFLTMREVQTVLSLSRTKCYELVASGELPAVKIGRSVRVHRRGLEEWLAKRGYAQNTELPGLVPDGGE